MSHVHAKARMRRSTADLSFALRKSMLERLSKFSRMRGSAETAERLVNGGLIAARRLLRRSCSTVPNATVDVSVPLQLLHRAGVVDPSEKGSRCVQGCSINCSQSHSGY